VRPRRTGRKRGVEIEIERRIDRQRGLAHVDDVDAVIAFAMDLIALLLFFVTVALLPRDPGRRSNRPRMLSPPARAATVPRCVS
jgi:hypothetical protein